MPSAFSRPIAPDEEQRKPLPPPVTLADTYLHDIATSLRTLADVAVKPPLAEAVEGMGQLRDPGHPVKRRTRGEAV